jgi:hypothetical protein
LSQEKLTSHGEQYDSPKMRWSHRSSGPPWQFRGIEFPYVHHVESPSCWPNQYGGGPGWEWWICTGCGNEIGRTLYGGDGYALEQSWKELAATFVYHRDNCPALKP